MERGAARWRILAVLFTVRTAMAFQFQTIGALSPLFAESYGVSLAEIGLLVGLYLSPGIALALPGGLLGARFGDKRMVLVGLLLMVFGGVLSIVGGSFQTESAARLIAGTGGVILNVLMTKMVADWFAGREIGTAMGIFVNSWPVGIALALIILPLVAGAGGLLGALAVVTLTAIFGFGLFAALYRAPPSAAGGRGAAALPRGAPLAAVFIAGSIWGLYNGAFSMIFSFGPALLTERGLTLAEASASISLILWLGVASVPVGGIIADQSGRRDLVLVAGLAIFGAALLFVWKGGDPLLGSILLGVAWGLPVAPIMSLPAAVLAPNMLAAGMGVFYTLHYLFSFAAPTIAGWIAEAAGGAASTYLFGVFTLTAAAGLLVVFRALTGPRPVAT
ncbi:MFS transporter [Pikeienuella piscinae]|uniref:Lysosomal dipeptide transporter MFSD1 n=1 Tax=Pikeienuella piscinae TaxID=2748098 RepID=A0A7L5C1F9_9RHOB|nr:MFS transporter [Pikeienuella piscinae]QIE56316.1 MFS transporter [Pikeienuella piscinae]